MACCLTAPSHYLNQCWFNDSKFRWHSYEGNLTQDTLAINLLYYLENNESKFSIKSPRANELKLYMGCFSEFKVWSTYRTLCVVALSCCSRLLCNRIQLYFQWYQLLSGLWWEYEIHDIYIHMYIYIYIYMCWFHFVAPAQGNAYKPTKEPINYHGPGGDWTYHLQTEATPPAASCPARSLHATEIVSKNTIPMTCPRLHWTTNNPSAMHRCQFQHP